MFDKFFSFSSIGQDKSKVQKQIRKLFILTEMAASLYNNKNNKNNKNNQ